VPPGAADFRFRPKAVIRSELPVRSTTLDLKCKRTLDAHGRVLAHLLETDVATLVTVVVKAAERVQSADARLRSCRRSRSCAIRSSTCWRGQPDLARLDPALPRMRARPASDPSIALSQRVPEKVSSATLSPLQCPWAAPPGHSSANHLFGVGVFQTTCKDVIGAA
jgi:hypothetical protein